MHTIICKYKNAFTIILLLIVCTNITAQSVQETNGRHKVYGKVAKANDTVNTTIPYVTVRLIDSKRAVAGAAVTDSKGNFTIYVKSAGKYLMKFDVMGFVSDSLAVEIKEPIQNLGIIRLMEGEELIGVTVSAKRLIMRDEGDRFVYDVTQDPEAKRVKMMDIMRKVPNLSVNSQGKLTYLDEDIYTIRINGKNNEMINGSRQFTMRLIKGDVMSRIELILPNTPENKSDKTIINIKLARDLPEGYAADLNITGNTRNTYKGKADIVAKIDNIYLSTTYGIGYTNSPRVDNLTVKENLNSVAEIKRQENNYVSYNEGVSHQLNIGSSFKLSEKDDLSISLNTSQSVVENFLNSSTTNYSDLSNIIGANTSNSKNKNNSRPKLNGYLSYSREIKDAVIGFNYSLTDKRDFGDYLTFKYDTPGGVYSNKMSTEQENSTLDQSASITFSKIHDNTKFLNAEISYIKRKYHNSSVLNIWDYNENETYNYDYNQEGLDYIQEIYRVIGGYNYFNQKKNFTLSCMLGVEKMINKGIFNKADQLSSLLDYNDFILLPNISISYNFPKRLKMGLSYKTRTLRPSISYLNPYEDISDPDNIFKGNPNLTAEYAQGLSLIASKVFGNYTTFTFIAGSEFINNAIEKTTTINKENTSITTYDNLGFESRYIIRLSLSLMPMKGFRVNNVIALNNQKYHNKSTGLSNEVTGFSYTGSLSYALSKKSQLYCSINVSPLMGSSQTKKVGYNTSLRFNYSRTLVKDKLFMNISLEDPFSKHRFLKNTIGNDFFSMTTSREQLGRILGFSLEWNFGRLKDKGATTDKSARPSDLSRPTL